MHSLLIGGSIGFFAGGILTYLFSTRVIAEYHKAAAEVGYLFEEINGKVKAVRKAL